jgi:hypothetical protein
MLRAASRLAQVASLAPVYALLLVFLSRPQRPLGQIHLPAGALEFGLRMGRGGGGGGGASVVSWMIRVRVSKEWEVVDEESGSSREADVGVQDE